VERRVGLGFLAVLPALELLDWGTSPPRTQGAYRERREMERLLTLQKYGIIKTQFRYVRVRYIYAFALTPQPETR
jgi:hypothetical protein